MSSSFGLAINQGLPLKTIPNPDGTTTLQVGIQTDVDPFFQNVPRIANGYAAASATTPGSPLTLLSYTVAASADFITGLSISCRAEGMGFLFVDGQEKGSIRTGAAMPTASLNLFPASEIAASGSLVEVVFTARLNSAPAPVECKLSGFQKI